MKQTAVEWLVEKIKIKYDIDFYHIKKEINQAKELEKQQIIDAYQKGYRNGGDNFGYGNKTTPIEYYNETFNK